ncbi:hypothetical protein [Actinomadura atramentaria]|uniref:hypothetical protein n=1 Tax=Actinomadura atramentaria TaxID=1990 RepID=UPI00035D4D8A|nr:hypothetical protein [Actinomadura atramentaria]
MSAAEVYEIHLTVGGGPDRLDAFAAARGLKAVHIVLDRGRVPSQPMLTRRVRGPLDAAFAAARATAAELVSAGIPVVRTKIEGAPGNPGVPVDDAAARRADPARYFEHHVKLVLPPDADLARLAALVEPHTAHLSRNARRVRADGRRERFVTQRCRAVGDRTAARRLAALTLALRDACHEIASVEREYVVHDGDASLDDGWIAEEDPR